MATKTHAPSRARPAAVPPPLIAERAYFKAEQRGFAPGYEIDDWLEAERELAPSQPPKPKRARKPRSAGA